MLGDLDAHVGCCLQASFKISDKQHRKQIISVVRKVYVFRLYRTHGCNLSLYNASSIKIILVSETDDNVAMLHSMTWYPTLLGQCSGINQENITTAFITANR